MAKDLKLSITEMFSEALSNNVGLELKTQQDWDAFQTIRNDAQTLADVEVATFTRDRPTLLNKAREEIMRDAGALKHDHPSPFGTDKFDKSRINAEAARRVDGAHQSRLTKIREDEIGKYTDLSDSIRARGQEKGRSREAFNRATDRRTGAERRVRSRD